MEELPTHGGSLRIDARHAEDESKLLAPAVHRLAPCEENAGLVREEHYPTFGGKARETNRCLLAFLIDARNSGKRIVGHGAAAKGNMLRNYCGTHTDFVDSVVDRNPHKQGLFLPGTRISILPADEIAKTRPDFLPILPWILREDVRE